MHGEREGASPLAATLARVRCIAERAASPKLRLGRTSFALALLLAVTAVGPASAAGPAPLSTAELRARTAAIPREVRAPVPPRPSQFEEGEPILPANRVVAIYGAPQLGSTALGERSSRSAAKLAARQARAYVKRGERPAIPALDLIGVVANSTPGPDRLYRTRQPDDLIAEYLKRVRAIGGRLMIDIQPGRSPILDEIEHLEPWLDEPDVDIAIDPEWNVGRHGVPGRTVGRVTASEINAASRALQRLVADEDLPPKILVVHQFHKGSIRKRRRVKERRDVEVTFNFDGIGAPGPKIAGYEALASSTLFNGFSVFYDLDTKVMSPKQVLGLDPVADFLLYQ